MSDARPLFDLATRYRIELRGRIDPGWLQCMMGSVEAIACEAPAADGDDAITVLSVSTDQAGMVGVVRRLHGLGLTILLVHIVSP